MPTATVIPFALPLPQVLPTIEGNVDYQEFRSQLLRCIGALDQEGVDQAADFRFFPPEAIALEGALAGHVHALDGADATKVLDEGAVGQACGKAAEILVDEETRDVAP